MSLDPEVRERIHYAIAYLLENVVFAPPNQLADAIIDRLGLTELGYARIFSILAAEECSACGSSAIHLGDDGEFYCPDHVGMDGVG